MVSRNESKIYKILTQEPVTPSEVANRLGVSYKTAQKILLELAATKKDIAYRKSGRILLFWRKSKGE